MKLTKTLLNLENPKSLKGFLKIYTNPKIYSFEPQKKCFQKLKSYKNKDCIIENIAFGEKKEVKSIFIYKDSSTSSLYNLSKNTKYNKDLNVESEETINIETLDNYVKKNNKGGGCGVLIKTHIIIYIVQISLI